MEQFFVDTALFTALKKSLTVLFDSKITRFTPRNKLPVIKSDVESFAQHIYKRGIIQKQTFNSNFLISNHFKRPYISIDSSIDKVLNEHSHTKTFFIIDKNVSKIYTKYFLHLTTNSYFTFRANECYKSLEAVKDIITQITKSSGSIDKIVVIGGGVTLDTGAFVASILQSKLILVPTTLLSAIDASAGGKTGVNFDKYGKNQIGSFYFCDEVRIIPALFSTLPRKELISGLCEALKHAWISGSFLKFKDKFEFLYTYFENTDEINSSQLSETLGDFISENLSTKLNIVQTDPYETIGTRAILNFGHTIAHALETYAIQNSETIPHGIAVAHGMKFIIEQYTKITWQDTSKFENSILNNHLDVLEFKSFLNKITEEFPVTHTNFLSNEFQPFLKQDKKNINQTTIAFTTPEYGILNSHG